MDRAGLGCGGARSGSNEKCKDLQKLVIGCASVYRLGSCVESVKTANLSNSTKIRTADLHRLRHEFVTK